MRRCNEKARRAELPAQRFSSSQQPDADLREVSGFLAQKDGAARERATQRHFGAAAKAIEAERERKAAEYAWRRIRPRRHKCNRSGGSSRYAFSNPEAETDKLQTLYNKLVEARTETGEQSGVPSLKDFTKFVRTKTADLKSKGGKEVEYTVSIEGGKVKAEGGSRRSVFGAAFHAEFQRSVFNSPKFFPHCLFPSEIFPQTHTLASFPCQKDAGDGICQGGTVAIERALISVYDKAGVVEFAKGLAEMGAEVLSTGGTAKLLRDAGVPVRDVADFTGWPEMLGGRVKTLHPKVHGGILYQRGKEEDRRQVAEHGIKSIDLVAVNLYPFSATAAKPGVTPEELIENIDIGGPAMVRSAAKNFPSVGVVTDPADYDHGARGAAGKVSNELSLATRLGLARKAYARTSRYDSEIATELERLAANGSVTMHAPEKFPQRIRHRAGAAADHALRRRKSAPGGGLFTPPRARRRARPGGRESLSGQGALLQ